MPHKLTDAERLLVERRIGEGLGNKVISQRLGISIQTISEIRRQLKRLGEQSERIDPNRYYSF